MKTAILECGTVTEVPDCCVVGGITACPKCPAPEGAPGDPDSSEVVTVPRMRPVWRHLLDIMKIYGGDAEGFWRACGTYLETHPQSNCRIVDILPEFGPAVLERGTKWPPAE